MRLLLTGALWRYLSIALQFFVVALVTNNVSAQGVALFITMYGVAQVAYVASGLGLPDGIVQRLPTVRRARGDAFGNVLLRRTLLISTATTFALAAAVGLVCVLIDPALWWAAPWALGYG